MLPSSSPQVTDPQVALRVAITTVCPDLQPRPQTIDLNASDQTILRSAKVELTPLHEQAGQRAVAAVQRSIRGCCLLRAP
jgi:hypothetical protein